MSQKDVEKSARQLNNSYFTLVLILQALVNIYCGEKKYICLLISDSKSGFSKDRWEEMKMPQSGFRRYSLNAQHFH